MSCTFKEPTWTQDCKTSIETQGLPQVLAGYDLTDAQKKCVYDKLYANYTPATMGDKTTNDIINTYIPDCKKNSSHTVLIIIIILIVLGAIAGTVFYLKHKGVLKL